MLFQNIVGQSDLKSRFTSEIQEGRIPHALMFAGPSGSGSLALALAYAQYLCCEHRSPSDSCGVCPSCIKWKKLVHPDLHFMFPIVRNARKKLEVCADFLPEWREALIESPYLSLPDWLGRLDASNGQALIYARESDEISRALSLKSSEGGYKVTIIWLPERMHEVCANKLLKILEEPPQKTVFLLVSEAPEQLLPTIRSRVQCINVPRIDSSDIEAHLTEALHLSPEEAGRIAHTANGNYRKALEELESDTDKTMFLELFIRLMRLAYMRRIREMKQWSEEVAALGRERIKRFFAYCQHMIRENFIYNLRCPSMNYMNGEELAFSSRFSPFINERNVIGMMEEISLAERHIEQNVNAKMVCFDFSLKMIVLLKQ